MLISKMGFALNTTSTGHDSPPSENWTITCFACGMPSSSVWAKLVQCHSSTTSTTEPYFPFLLKLQSPNPNGAVLKEDGTTHLCAFCFASLEAQWNAYEKMTNQVQPNDRKYNLQKFVCAVCAVQTYRKRIRALPFQEFPFLVNERQPGSLTLGQNPLAIVCLDCSETLWAQSAEYERWGLPIQKRHFNWMARPPPPENSMEATVARLPSGETQLPRCPPTEPSVTRVKIQPLSIPIAQPIQNEAKSNQNESMRKSYKSPSISANRKSSAPCLLNTEIQFPPVVTVAPMSSHKNSVSMRKGSTTVPPNSDSAKIEGVRSSNGLLSKALSSPYIPKATPSNMLDSPNYNGLFQWPPPRDQNNSFNSLETNPWPWIPVSPSADFLNYQTYLSSMARTSYTSPGSCMPSPHSLYSGPLPAPHIPIGLSTPPYLPNFASPRHASDTGGGYSPYILNSSTLYGQPCNTPGVECSQPANRETKNDTGNLKSSTINIIGNENLKRKRSSSSSSGNCETLAHNNQTFLRKSESRRNSYGVSANISKTCSSTKNSELVKGPEQVMNGKCLPLFEKQLSPKLDDFKNEGERKHSHIEFGFGYTTQSKLNVTENLNAVDLSKRYHHTFNTSQNKIPRSRSSSFSIAFLCNESESPKQSPSNSSPTRDSVIVSTTSNCLSYGKDNSIMRSEGNFGLVNMPDVNDIVEDKNHLISQLQFSSANGDDRSTTKCKDMIYYNNSNGDSNLGSSLNSVYSGGTTIKPKSFKSGKIENIEMKNSEKAKQFIAKTMKEYKDKEYQRSILMNNENKKKAEFLRTLDLITPKQSSEIELNKVISRAEKRTLPLLRLRPESPKEITREGDYLLRKDVMLAVSGVKQLNKYAINSEQKLFLEQLGLKTTSQSDKLKMEQQWCLVLAEKILRRLRQNGAKNQSNGRKRSAVNLDDLSGALERLAKISRIEPIFSLEINQQMRNLSVVLASDTDDVVAKPWLLNSSDLLSIATLDNSANKGFDLVSKSRIVEPVITYPKYIPSYAISDHENGNLHLVEAEFKRDKQERPANILIIPSVTRPCTSSNTTTLQEIGSLPNIPSICIPKAPALSICGRTNSESSHCENHNPEFLPSVSDVQNNCSTNNRVPKNVADGKLVQVHTNSSLITITKSNICLKKFPGSDIIIGRYVELWTCIQDEIDNLLSSVSFTKGDKTEENYAIGEIKKLRRALATYQSAMKITEKKLRRGERELTKFTSQSHCTARTNNTHCKPNCRKLIEKKLT